LNTLEDQIDLIQATKKWLSEKVTYLDSLDLENCDDNFPEKYHSIREVSSDIYFYFDIKI